MENENGAVRLPLETVRVLVSAGSGDAALVYLANLLCARNGGEISSITGFSRARLAGAMAALGDMGVRLPDPPLFTPQEERGEEAVASSDVAAELDKKGEFSQLAAEAEKRLETKLSTPSLTILMNIYSSLDLPTDVLYLLLTYCVEDTERYYGANRKPTMRQIEKEAYRWARMELDTTEKAEAYIMKRAFALEKAGEVSRILGITGRKPVRSEENYITRWLEWGFGPEEIETAYDKTVLKTGGLSWKYLNTILKNWHEKDLHTLDEINSGDGRRGPEPRSDEYEQEAIDWARRYRQKRGAGGGPAEG